MATESFEIPDVVLVTDDRYKEELKITITKKLIKFSGHIDGTGQDWQISKEKFIDILRSAK